MRLSELSALSGVPIATIKYYLREGLLPPRRQISASQAEYTEAHLRRIRLVRALIQVGGMSVARTREVLGAAEDESLDQHQRFGTVLGALAGDQGTGEPELPPGSTARATVDELLDEVGWECCEDPQYWVLVRAVAALERLGYPCDLAHLRPYAAAVTPLARTDLRTIGEFPPGEAQLEAVVALTVLNEPVLLALRRIAHSHVSGQEFGARPAQ